MTQYSDSFSLVWKMYPNKKNKFQAFQKFEKLGFDEVDQLKEWISVQEWPEETKFIPHLVTVINQKRWLDTEDTDEKKYMKDALQAWSRLKGHIKTYGTQFGPRIDEDLREPVRMLGGLQAVGQWRESEVNQKKLIFFKYYIESHKNGKK